MSLALFFAPNTRFPKTVCFLQLSSWGNGLPSSSLQPTLAQFSSFAIFPSQVPPKLSDIYLINSVPILLTPVPGLSCIISSPGIAAICLFPSALLYLMPKQPDDIWKHKSYQRPPFCKNRQIVFTELNKIQTSVRPGSLPSCSCYTSHLSSFSTPPCLPPHLPGFYLNVARRFCFCCC